MPQMVGEHDVDSRSQSYDFGSAQLSSHEDVGLIAVALAHLIASLLERFVVFVRVSARHGLPIWCRARVDTAASVPLASGARDGSIHTGVHGQEGRWRHSARRRQRKAQSGIYFFVNSVLIV